MGNTIVSLSGKKVMVTGALKSVGLAIVEKLIEDGNVSVALLSKTKESDTDEFMQSARISHNADVRFFPTDLTSKESIEGSVEKAATAFDGIDIFINAASVLLPTTDDAEKNMQIFMLSNQVNYHSTYTFSQVLFKYLKDSDCGYFLNISPPINLDPKAFSASVSFTSSQYARSLLTIALAEEKNWKEEGVLINSLWPLKPSSSMNFMLYQPHMQKTERQNSEAIMAEATHYLLTVDRNQWTPHGEFLYDEEVLEMKGVSFAELNNGVQDTYGESYYDQSSMGQHKQRKRELLGSSNNQKSYRRLEETEDYF